MSRDEQALKVDPPRVLLVGPLPVPPVTGGVEKGIDMLLRTDLARRTKMRLFNNSRRRDPRRPLHARFRYQVGMIRSFRRELQQEPVDLIHVKTSSDINFYQNSLYALMARRSGLPVLLQIHGGMFEVFYQESLAPLRAWIRHTLSSVDRVAVLSRGWADRIARIAPQARLAVVPNGLEAGELASLGEVDGNRPEQVLFVGTGDPELNCKKGLDDLLEVLPRLLTRFPAVTWVLAGLHNPMEARNRVKGSLEPGTRLGERVRFLPLVGGETRLALLRESSILVVPSRYENMPNLLLEAMAAGMGVVASNVGAIEEMLSPPDGGIIFEAADRDGLMGALERLLACASLVSEQGRRNRATVTRQYTLSVVERELEKIYRECVQDRITHPSRRRDFALEQGGGTHPRPPSGVTRSVGR